MGYYFYMRKNVAFHFPTLVLRPPSHSLSRLALITTLCFSHVVCVNAAINDPSPDFSETAARGGQAQKKSAGGESDNASPASDLRSTSDRPLLETITIADPALAQRGRSKGERTRVGYFHPFRNAFTLECGASYRSPATEDGSDGKNLHTLFGAQYFYTTRVKPRSLQTANADSDSDSDGQLFRGWEAGGWILSDGTGRLHFSRRFSPSQTRFRPYTSLGVGVHLVPKDELVTILRLRNYEFRVASGFEFTPSGLGVDVHLRLEASIAAGSFGVEGTTKLGYVLPF